MNLLYELWKLLTAYRDFKQTEQRGFLHAFKSNFQATDSGFEANQTQCGRDCKGKKGN